MYSIIDPKGDDIYAYSYKAGDLVAKILSAATANNNIRTDYQIWSSKIREIGKNVTMKINTCV
jgi:hypothetical protein